MGCDIHIIAEVKKEGQWVLNTEPPSGRSYDWFSILADVRESLLWSNTKEVGHGH